MSPVTFLHGIERIYRGAHQSENGQRCMVAPHPQLQKRLQAEMLALADAHGDLGILRTMLHIGQPSGLGFNDGVILPPSYFPMTASPQAIRNASANRAPLRGELRIAVILVEFDDQLFDVAHTPAHYSDLFFSEGKIPTGSVREYFQEVTHGMIEMQGEVIGPLRLPRSLADYANGDSGTGNARPNARTMARDAAIAADSHITFSLYDNDHDGFVDAFVIVHAGRGAEVTGNPSDIWSHKWVLEGGELSIDSTKIFAYLTVPEDAKIGVCCHELGHLMFGFPDLYDADGTSNGVGDWCLMGGGSWGGGGLRPVHPSAWCKANQGWASVENISSTMALSIPDVKSSQTVHRLWKNGIEGPEYFLMENRQRTGYDAELPGDGLLIWHIDDNVSSNTNEFHYKVALMQADGNRSLEKSPTAGNRGDAGDPYPGTANNRTFSNSSNPNSKAYNGQPSHVTVANISNSQPVMTATISVGGSGVLQVTPTLVTLPQVVARVEALERIVLAPPIPDVEVGEPQQSNGNGNHAPLSLLHRSGMR